MTAREKNLSIAVGTIVILLVNYFLIEFFFTNEKKLRNNFKLKTTELHNAQLLLQDKELWEKRNTQLDALQPKLTRESEISAPGALTEQVTEMGKKLTFVPEELVMGSLKKGPYYNAVSISFETKSTWEVLCGLLRGMQGPDQFIVFESANIQVDSADKTLHRGKFQISKWYAPN